MNISIEIKERDTDHIDIFVAGEIDAYTAPRVKEALEVYQVKEGIVLRIDLTEVSYMDSTGLGVFVGAFKSLRQRQSELVLFGLSDRLFRLFEITGLSDIIEIKNVEGEMNGNNA
ncbi:anti sigma b factor antagonist RsbV [Listeria monocytogenes]|uniref:anti sigma b factor antagonist RsbV n=1 Tax=Listeria monocytogenes TaxID=1639 RepID=UPI00074D5944|nr:anti sigma b factor antagonist RsbV [Listeria monocytogenes]EJC5379633.1 anti sigma b factor antagonist RsbV [Listeria monocytogenes]EKL6377258.1 anti sigma b factor antagonist RsbV [Listeria monocytogenes]EKN1192232.1 anti sigma b factor antagonist RsbV [Listeria monocytogenes]MBK3696072.1 anti sigma b factor antagonist RsbV [Listeria monocytogenes]MBX9518163.1 anti sigma b factor antagonist RsbV [Listeria monocytogenes]